MAGAWQGLLFPALCFVVWFAEQKGIDFDDPLAVHIFRWFYGWSSLLLLICMWQAYCVVVQRNDQRVVEVKKKATGKEPAKVELLTYTKYDQGELSNLASQFIWRAGFTVAVFHLYMRMSKPLIFQGILMPISTLASPVLKINYFGYSEEDEDCQRPFPDPNQWWSKPEAEAKEGQKVAAEAKKDK